MHKYTVYFLTICLFCFFFSCNCDDEMPSGNGCPEPTELYGSGIFIVNEGKFQDGTGTLSFIDENTSELSNRIYQEANCDAIIGNIFQSVTHSDGKLYLVVNNAEKVMVTDDEKIDFLGEITGLKQPRYLLKINENTAYVTQWIGNDKGNVAVVDLDAMEIISTIPAGGGPEHLVAFQNKIYVSNAGGQNFQVGDSTILIINPATHTVEKTLVVGRNPNSFQIDKNGDLWVSCKGFSPNFDALDPNNINGRLVRIRDEAIQEIIDLGKIGAEKMQINPAGDRIYFLQNGFGFNPVYTFDIPTKTVSETPFIDKEVYGLGVNPANGHLFLGDANGFAETGEVLEYDENGNLLQSFFTSIGPSQFIFK